MAEARFSPQPNSKFCSTAPVNATKVEAVSPLDPLLSKSDGEGKRPVIIGVAGGSASGKTSVCRRIMEALGQNHLCPTERNAVVINEDSFYRELNEGECVRADKGEYNFDHPDAYDHELMKRSLRDLVMGKSIDVPVYDYKTHARSKTEKRTVYPADVILLEGILVLYDSELRDMMAVKLFVDTDSDTRLARRIQRDIRERGGTVESILEQYLRYVKPAFEKLILPTKEYADVIIPRGALNDVAIEMIVQHIKVILEGKMKAEYKRSYPAPAIRKPLFWNLRSALSKKGTTCT